MIAIVVAFGSVAVWTIAAQEPRLAFDVASVKRNVSGEPGFGGPIFAAVEEQLGLRVERRREPALYDVLVIKSAEPPSEN